MESKHPDLDIGSNQALQPTAVHSMHIYGVRPRKDKRGVDLISDALPFGRLWYGARTQSATQLAMRDLFCFLGFGLPECSPEGEEGVRSKHLTFAS
jgi:hypothetical protein